MNDSIDELIPIQVNGTKQWLLCRGNDVSKPIVFFVHGGPSSPLMFFSRAFDNHLLDDFVFVHWDQRGAGKSFDPGANPEDYTFDTYVRDGLEVVDFLRIKFQTEKIIVAAHSWGTMVAFQMIRQKLGYFHALVSIGTVVNRLLGDQELFSRVRRAVEDNADEQELCEIDLLQPPYLNFDSRIKFSEYQKKYLGTFGLFGHMTMTDLDSAVAMSREYTTDEMQSSMQGMKIVYNKFASFIYQYDAYQMVPELIVPTYFVQGSDDTQTPTFLVKEFFERVPALAGSWFFELPETGHFPMYERPDEFFRILKRIAVDAI